MNVLFVFLTSTEQEVGYFLKTMYFNCLKFEFDEKKNQNNGIIYVSIARETRMGF